MKYLASLPLIFFFVIQVYAQDSEKKDRSVIKSEIKDLQKLIKEQTKEVEKIEKSLASVRPNLEQAKIDVDILETRRDSIKAAAEAFDFPSKQVELKSLNKQYKKAEKSRAKAEKTIAKSEERISAANSEVAVAKNSQANAEGKLSNHRMTNPDSLGVEAQKIHIAKDKELEKTVTGHGKTVKKQESTIKKIEQAKDEATTQFEEYSKKSIDLKTQVDDLTREMEINNPKVIEKELNSYAERISERQAELEDLQLEFDQKTANIAEKHDLIEVKKKEKEEKESMLRRD